MSYKVACLDVYDPLVKEVIQRASPSDWSVTMAQSYEEEEQRRVVEGADFILAGWAPVPGWMFDSPSLKMVQKFGVGYDKIDTETARTRGITVAIAAGMNAVPVSELVVLLILSLYRKVVYLNETMRSGRWVKSEMRAKSYQIFGKTVGLLGLGFVGREVAKRLNAFGAKVVYYDLHRLPNEEEQRLGAEYREFAALLGCSDIISLHTPLTKETRSFIGREQLSMMKESAVLINTARGELIDEDELLSALQERRLLGAGLDVFAQEPIRMDHPLLRLDNVVLTPHIGGTVLDNVHRMAAHCFENMQRYLHREPLPERDVIVGSRHERINREGHNG